MLQQLAVALFTILTFPGAHTSISSSQDYCHFDHIIETEIFSNASGYDAFEKSYLQYMHGHERPEGAAQYELPVVFHVIHNGGAENISDQQVQSALDMLNASFGNIDYYDPNTGIDTEIQFCLATQDEDGQPTTGINRVPSALTRFNYNIEERDLKGLSIWDPLSYINIWIVEEITSNNGPGVAGYAYFPTSHGSDVDGIVVEARYTGDAFDENAILTHEMGHYLGLYHTFQNGCQNDDCLQDGDRVCDTPPDNTTARPPCDRPGNSCDTDANSGFASDMTDMIINYMDYSALECYSAFTDGQRQRMHFSIEMIRSSLLNSKGCEDPCPISVVASATTSAASFFVGETVNFINTSTNGISYEWWVNGNLISQNTNFDFTFLSEGIYEIELKVFGSSPECRADTTWTFKVDCEAEALFDISQSAVSSGDRLLLTDQSTNATNIRWYINGQLVSNRSQIDTLIQRVGVYEIYLVADNQICTDTSQTVLLTVYPENYQRFGLPGWPMLAPRDNNTYYFDWRTTPFDISHFSSNQVNFGGQTGAGFDDCGGLQIVVMHNGTNQDHSLYIFGNDGRPLLDDVVNAPGLSAVRGRNEIQVIPVPNRDLEWYIIYNAWTSDAGWPLDNAGYAPLNIFYSHVALDGRDLRVISRDQLLTVNGQAWHYTDGKAVSRTAGGRTDAHYLYATRRAFQSSTLSLDRFLITENDIQFDANTGEVPAQWWYLSMAASPIELSPTEDRIAVVNRNQDRNYNDIFVFDAAAFDNNNVSIISLGDLNLKADGLPRDQSSILNSDVIVENVTQQANLPLHFLSNMERKVACIEFSPNGRFLFFGNGGYAQSGTTNLTYLGQIDLNSARPFDLRLQIQTTPNDNYNPGTGIGCSRSVPGCQDNFHQIFEMESAFDGNLYFSKGNVNKLFVIPDPDDFMPQNLVPSEIDLSTTTEPNIDLPFFQNLMPDQIDGFNYLKGDHLNLPIVVTQLDCDSLCDADYIVELLTKDSLVIDEMVTSTCPDTLFICIDTSKSYLLRSKESGVTFLAVKRGGVLNYPIGKRLFDFSNFDKCKEICGNMIDDDGDGLVDCDDPDIKDSCCCVEPPIVDLGPDVEMCENGVVVLDAGPGFDLYVWQDGFQGQIYTADGPGTYWVVAADSCGNEVSDTIIISVIPMSELDVGGERTICLNDSLSFTRSPFQKWEWSPDLGLSCDTCLTVVIHPTIDTQFIIVAEYGPGCLSVDTLNVKIRPGWEGFDSLKICRGDTVDINGKPYFEAGDYQQIFSGSGVCDSIQNIHISWQEEVKDTLLFSVCDGDSLNFRGEWLEEGIYTRRLSSIDNCDSILTIEIVQFDAIQYSLVADSVCPGDSSASILLTIYEGILKDVMWSSGETNVNQVDGLSAGVYGVIIIDENGCQFLDSTKVNEYILQRPDLRLEEPICPEDSVGWLSLSNHQAGSYFLNGQLINPQELAGPLDPGTYDLRYITNAGCDWDTSFIIQSPQVYSVFLLDTITIHYGDQIKLVPDVQPPGSYTYQWQPCENLSCCDCISPVFSGVESQLITLLVTDENGCEQTLTIYIKVQIDKRVFVPNVFSPNGDGLNDRVQIFGSDDLEGVISLKIFDRWGELIYVGGIEATNGNQGGWDGTFHGKPMNPAVFTYVAKVRFIDGDEQQVSGSITLMK